MAIIGAIALAILGAAAGTFIAFWLAPEQQARQQQGLDNAQDQEDASSPAVLVQDQRYAGETRSEATSRVLELAGTTLTITPGSPGTFLPAGQNVEPGPLSYADVPDPAQPEVYDQMYFTMVGNHYKTVKINSITARIVSREPPPAGTLLWKSPQGASDDESIGFDLDSTDLAAHTTVLVSSIPHITNVHYFDERQVTLERNEKLEFKVTVFTENCFCRFVFDIKTDDGKVQTADNKGTPWQASAFAPSYQRSYAVDLSDPRGPTIVACGWPQGCQEY
jgi:hypothetical protein